MNSATVCCVCISNDGDSQVRWPRWSISQVKSLPMRSSRLMRRSSSCARDTVPSNWRRTIHAVIRPARVSSANDSVRDSACICAMPAVADSRPRFSATSSTPISTVFAMPSTMAVGMLTSMPDTATSSTAPPSTMEWVPSPECQACSISASRPTVSDSVAEARFQPRRESAHAPAPPANSAAPINARDCPSKPNGPSLRCTRATNSSKAPTNDTRMLKARTARTAYGSTRWRATSSCSS